MVFVTSSVRLDMTVTVPPCVVEPPVFGTYNSELAESYPIPAGLILVEKVAVTDGNSPTGRDCAETVLAGPWKASERRTRE